MLANMILNNPNFSKLSAFSSTMFVAPFTVMFSLAFSTLQSSLSMAVIWEAPFFFGQYSQDTRSGAKVEHGLTGQIE